MQHFRLPRGYFRGPFVVNMMYFISKEEFAEKTQGVMGGDEEIEFNME